MMINLYKLHFLSSHFSSQSNKRFFHPFTFQSFNQHIWGKTKSFLSSNFFISTIKWILITYWFIRAFTSKMWKILKWYFISENTKRDTTSKLLYSKKYITLSYSMLLEIAGYYSLNLKKKKYIYIYIYIVGWLSFFFPSSF